MDFHVRQERKPFQQGLWCRTETGVRCGVVLELIPIISGQESDFHGTKDKTMGYAGNVVSSYQGGKRELVVWEPTLTRPGGMLTISCEMIKLWARHARTPGRSS